MKYKKNFFFVASILVLLSHNAYCAEYGRTLVGHRNILNLNIFSQDKEYVDNLRNDLQKLDEAQFLFENSIKNANFKELDDKCLEKWLAKTKDFATRIMSTRLVVAENGNRLGKYQEILRAKCLMSQQEQCDIIRRLDNMYSKNNDLLDLLFIAKRVQNLGI